MMPNIIHTLDFNRHVRKIYHIVQRGNHRLLGGSGESARALADTITQNVMLQFIKACRGCMQRNLLQSHQKSMNLLRAVQPIIFGAIHGEMSAIEAYIRETRLHLDRLDDTLDEYQAKIHVKNRKAVKQATRSTIAVTKIQIKEKELLLQQAAKTYLLLSKQADWMEEFTFVKPRPYFRGKE